MGGQAKKEKITFFKRPLSRDWFWWWAVFVVGLSFYMTARFDYASGLKPTTFYLVAFSIDAALRTAFNLLLLVMPIGIIRRSLRKRRIRKAPDPVVEGDE